MAIEPEAWIVDCPNGDSEVFFDEIEARDKASEGSDDEASDRSVTPLVRLDAAEREISSRTAEEIAAWLDSLADRRGQHTGGGGEAAVRFAAPKIAADIRAGKWRSK